MPRGLFAFTLAAAFVTGTPAAFAAEGSAAAYPQRPIRTPRCNNHGCPRCLKRRV